MIKGLLTALVLLSSLCLTAQVHAMTLNIATLYPEGTGVVNHLQQAGRDIHQATDGRVSMRVLAGGTMGDDRAVLRRIRIGQLHGALSQAGAFASFYKDSQVLNLPLAFRDYDEVDHVRSHLDPIIRQGFEDNDWIVFGPVDGGFAYLMTKEPVETVGQLRQQKVWVPANDPASAMAAEAFDVSPTVLDIGAVLTSLQTGVIDAFAAPPVAALTLQWHGRVSHLTDMPLLYTYGLLGISAQHFRRLSEADQKAVRRILDAAFVELNQQARNDNISAFKALKNQEIELVKPGQQALDEWRRYARRATGELVEESHISVSMYQQLRALLDDYRNGTSE